MTDVTMRQLLEVGVHFGHQTRFWCPKMAPYIYGHRNKIHIINLELTLSMFNEAMNYLSAVAASRGTVMFVGTKSQAGAIIQEQAQRANSPYVYHRWLGGMLTNYKTVRQSIERLTALEELSDSESYAQFSKKETLTVEREKFRLNRNLAGIRNMKGLPTALFVIDVKHENIAIKEANKLGIPVVAVVDTNCDPDGIDYVIPGNDDSISAIKLYCTQAANAILNGYATRQNEPYVYDDEAETDLNAMVNTGVTSAKAAVAPDDSDSTSESEATEPEAQSAAEEPVAEVAGDEVATDSEVPSVAAPSEPDVSPDTENEAPPAVEVESSADETAPVAAVDKLSSSEMPDDVSDTSDSDDD